MGKLKWKVGMASALAVGAGAAAVVAGRKKANDRGIQKMATGIQNAENRRKTARESIIPAVIMKLLHGQRSRRELKESPHTWWAVVWLH